MSMDNLCCNPFINLLVSTRKKRRIPTKLIFWRSKEIMAYVYLQTKVAYVCPQAKVAYVCPQARVKVKAAK